MPAAKPYLVLQEEKTSHRTKDELKARRDAEKALITGKKLKEWPETRLNPVAHKEFLRCKTVMQQIDKWDEIFAPTINRYCLILAECKTNEEKRQKFYQHICDIEEDQHSYAKANQLHDYYQTLAALEKAHIDLDKQVQAKRKMLLDLEKEMCFTVASAIRSIPKKTDKKKSAVATAIGK